MYDKAQVIMVSVFFLCIATVLSILAAQPGMTMVEGEAYRQYLVTCEKTNTSPIHPYEYFKEKQ